MKIYNTMGRKLEELQSIEPGKIKIYTCGPTVYDYQHIGNYTGYIYWDVLVRFLKSMSYDVQRIMNITDVGHLVSDADEGEDKLEKGAKREGKTAREVADFYTDDFLKSMKLLNLLEPKIYAKATDFIPQQIDIIKILLDKNFGYITDQAIYFDVTKLDDYGKLTGQKLTDKEVGARSEVVTDSSKHHPQDFALWFFANGRFAGHEMRWDSPWGEGFPGWHLECSAIIHATLGEPIDIHTGGVDHIGTHHTNEIAQTEAAFGTTLANYWLHNNHMMVDGKKISKSLGNGFTLKDLFDKGFSPADFKLLVMQAHYRNQINFSWDSLEAAQTNLKTLQAWADQVHQPAKETLTDDNLKVLENNVKEALGDDLNTAKALAAINEASGLGAPTLETLRNLDDLLGLQLFGRPDITEEQKELINQREQARQSQDWQRSDEIRANLAEQGLEINDTEHGPIWSRAV